MKNSRRDFSDVPVRVRSWGIIILILTLSLLTPTLTYIGVGLLSFGCMQEYFCIIHLKDKRLKWLAYSLVAVQLPLSYLNYYTEFMVIAITYAIIILFFFGRKAVAIAVLIAVFSIGTLSFIRNIDINTDTTIGIKLVVFLVVLTELNDVFQYTTGKFLGRHKITSRISPNKTVEGFAGGVVLTIITANIIGVLLLPNYSVAIYCILGVVISIIGITGDLFMSLVKRKLKIKDTGTLIPGHGGLLDRVDSLMFISPIFYWIILCL